MQQEVVVNDGKGKQAALYTHMTYVEGTINQYGYNNGTLTFEFATTTDMKDKQVFSCAAYNPGCVGICMQVGQWKVCPNVVHTTHLAQLTYTFKNNGTFVLNNDINYKERTWKHRLVGPTEANLVYEKDWKYSKTKKAMDADAKKAAEEKAKKLTEQQEREVKAKVDVINADQAKVR